MIISLFRPLGYIDHNFMSTNSSVLIIDTIQSKLQWHNLRDDRQDIIRLMKVRIMGWYFVFVCFLVLRTYNFITFSFFYLLLICWVQNQTSFLGESSELDYGEEDKDLLVVLKFLCLFWEQIIILVLVLMSKEIYY